MANFLYTYGQTGILNGSIDLDTSTIKALLVMSNTTADTEKDKQTLSGFTTLDEFDGSGYSRQTLSGKTVSADTTNHRSKMVASDITFTNISAGTRAIAAVVLYLFVTNDADSVPLAYIDTDGSGILPFTPFGGSLVVASDITGLIRGS